MAELADPACGQPLGPFVCNILRKLGYVDFVEEFQTTFFDEECIGIKDSTTAWWSASSEERPLAVLLFAEYYRGNNKPLIRFGGTESMMWAIRLPEHIKEQLSPLS